MRTHFQLPGQHHQTRHPSGELLTTRFSPLTGCLAILCSLLIRIVHHLPRMQLQLVNNSRPFQPTLSYQPPASQQLTVSCPALDPLNLSPPNLLAR